MDCDFRNNRKLMNVAVNLLVVFALDAYFDGKVLKIRYLLLIRKKSRLLDKDQSNDISEINGCVF